MLGLAASYGLSDVNCLLLVILHGHVRAESSIVLRYFYRV